MGLDNTQLKDLREDYVSHGISKKDMLDDPVEQFKEWFKIILKTEGQDANAMVLSTSTLKGAPSSRVVLLKEVDEAGFYFYTNYSSRKGVNMAENPVAQMLFVWMPLHRQIRIEGTIERISRTRSEEYFYSRPIESQIGAAVSSQSKEIKNREVLETAKKALEGKEIKMPNDWGGYCLTPNYFEFWQGSSGRLHDRICYEKLDDGWRKFRIAP